jgi:hypothetical protein
MRYQGRHFVVGHHTKMETLYRRIGIHRIHHLDMLGLMIRTKMVQWISSGRSFHRNCTPTDGMMWRRCGQSSAGNHSAEDPPHLTMAASEALCWTYSTTFR